MDIIIVYPIYLDFSGNSAALDLIVNAVQSFSHPYPSNSQKPSLESPLVSHFHPTRIQHSTPPRLSRQSKQAQNGRPQRYDLGPFSGRLACLIIEVRRVGGGRLFYINQGLGRAR